MASGNEIYEWDASATTEATRGPRLDAPGAVNGLAVAPTGDVYISREGSAGLEVFGPAATVPTPTTTAATGVTGTRASLSGLINPGGLPLTGCEFEYGTSTSYGQTVACEGVLPSGTGPKAVSANVGGLVPEGTTYHFRLVAENANGREVGADREFSTAHLAETLPPIAVGATGATLKGAVRPEGEGFSDCEFEYGLASSGSLDKGVGCFPTAESIEPDFAVHQLTADLSDLASNATYRFRIRADRSSGASITGEELEFTTQGPPQISEIRALNADETSTTLEAKINPRGFPTHYRFEWGPTASYGHSIPANGYEPRIGEGEQPISVTADLSGLTPGATYHYRVIARNGAGREAASSDHIAETLDACGLPEQRCFELVSPRDVGPVASPGQAPAASELHFQAASQPGSLAYVVEAGFPDATKGAEVLYQAVRGQGGGWTSTQLSGPIVAQNEKDSGNAFTSTMFGLSEDLRCGVLESNQPLTADSGASITLQAGGSNLYRRNPFGAASAYTALTSAAPENLDAHSALGEYTLFGMSQDCGKVVFLSPYRYAGVGVAGQGESNSYEWDHGTLRNVGIVPGPSGEVPAKAIVGTGSIGSFSSNFSNAVSADGSKVFFSAERKASGNLAEVGRIGVFVRENGAVTRDLSLSETSTSDTGAVYQTAAKDGSKVFFIANYGLTSTTSVGPTADNCTLANFGENRNTHCDLYEYDLESGKLTDLSVDEDPGGAEVAGVVGASDDGSHVYFLARGQLVPGEGRTAAQNQVAGTYSLYSEDSGAVKYVAPVGVPEKPRITAEELRRIGLEHQAEGEWTSQVSADGSYLLFETRANVTGYEAGNYVPEAYLVDSASGGIACISCRQDGEPSSSLNRMPPLAAGEFKSTNPLQPKRSLAISNGRPEAFFTSFDVLAAGAVEGRANLYEWTHDQVFTIASEPQGLAEPAEVVSVLEGVPFSYTKPIINFLGTSAEAGDYYLATPQTLNWEDGDERMSVYDARIGGGRAEPPSGPPSCSPTTEGACQAPPSPASPTSSPPASSTFGGPGNAKPRHLKKKRKRKHHRHHHKKRHGKKKHKKQGKKHARHAKGNGRARK